MSVGRLDNNLIFWSIDVFEPSIENLFLRKEMVIE